MDKRMYSIGLMTFFLVIPFSSCRVPYEPDIEADEEILIVDALLTNHTGASYVKLSMAMPYDVTGICPGVENATVYLTDETLNRISFSETSAGYYEPVDTAFAGEINITYELTVIMPDGCTYVSQPETIPEDMEPDSAYAGFDQLEYLTEDYYGKTVKVTEKVCALYFNYMGDTTMLRFRYNSSQVVVWPAGPFYYWRIYPDNSLRLTDQKFGSSSVNIYKQEVNVTPARKQILIVYEEDVPVTLIEYIRIAEVYQYRLNDDSYAYYKSVKAQSDVEGKLFDPILTPIKGNISCVNVPAKTVLGFFEASNLMIKTYIVRVQWLGSEITITEMDNLPPLAQAGYVKKGTVFWIP